MPFCRVAIPGYALTAHPTQPFRKYDDGSRISTTPRIGSRILGIAGGTKGFSGRVCRQRQIAGARATNNEASPNSKRSTRPFRILVTCLTLNNFVTSPHVIWLQAGDRVSLGSNCKHLAQWRLAYIGGLRLAPCRWWDFVRQRICLFDSRIWTLGVDSHLVHWTNLVRSLNPKPWRLNPCKFV